MENKIHFILKIKGIQKPSPILDIIAKREIQNIKIQINIKLNLFVAKEINLHEIPIYYKSQNQWKELSDENSIQNFIQSQSEYIMIYLNRIKFDYQRLGKNFNNFQSQVSLHNKRILTLSESQQQDENKDIIQEQSNTTRNPKIRILSSFVYEDMKDEMKNKIESAGQEFQQKLKDNNKKQLQQFQNQHKLDNIKFFALEREIIQCEQKKEQLQQILKDIKNQKINQNQLVIQKMELNNNIDKLQKEIDELQNKISKLYKDLILLADKMATKLKDIHIDSSSKNKLQKQGSLPPNFGRSPTSNVERQTKKINLNHRSRQAIGLRIHTFHPGNYEIGL